MHRKRQVGVLFEDIGCALAGALQSFSVLGQVGDVQLYQSTLLGALQVAWAAQAQVGFSDFKAVVGAHHGLNALPAIGTELERRHEDTVRLLGPASDAAAQLMQLRQSEAFGIFHHHDRGIGYVDADFDDGGRYHDLRLLPGESLHFCVFVCGFHFAVYHADLVGWGREIAL